MLKLRLILIILLLLLNPQGLFSEMDSEPSFMEFLALVLVLTNNLSPYLDIFLLFLLLGQTDLHLGVLCGPFFVTFVKLLDFEFHELDVALFHLDLLFDFEVEVFYLLV